MRKESGRQQVVTSDVVSVVTSVPAPPLRGNASGAQELLHVIEEALSWEIEGSGTTLLKTGEAAIIAADLAYPRPLLLPPSNEKHRRKRKRRWW